MLVPGVVTGPGLGIGCEQAGCYARVLLAFIVIKVGESFFRVREAVEFAAKRAVNEKQIRHWIIVLRDD